MDAQREAAFIRVENLSRRFAQGEHGQMVLSDVSFELRRGEMAALLGRSGSGKSTLLNLISGIDLADSGRVVIGGQDLSAMDEEARTLFRRRSIGFIFQFFNLVPSLSASENLALILELNGVPASAALRRAEAALSVIGLPDKAKAFPSQLSGGEQQRVAIARALIHQPALVLADEPTGNLDAQNGQFVLQLLREQVAQSRSSMLLVTHSLTVARAADRILTLENGIIEERSGDFAW